MALSRKTKKARTRATILKKETPESKRERLQNMKMRFTQYYSQLSADEKKELKDKKQFKKKNESQTSKQKRLQSQREKKTEKRMTESSDSRSHRLSQMRLHASQVRQNESPSSLEARLVQMREHASQVRQNESPSSREDRLVQMREHASQVRQNESPSSREDRLVQMREHASQVRQNESPSSREDRLVQMREHASQVRQNESPSSREKRLDRMRTYHCCRRRLFTEDSEFENTINHIADIVCYVCNKLLYPKQSRSVSTNHSTLLPNDTPGSIICCNRCATYISKNKIPPAAFWNNMTVSPIPIELANLSEIELRLISRLKPFIKVVRLGGRFGQQGFKGQAILFAQQIEEIAEQLPISMADAGLAIVAESLENINNTRRYSIDIDKLQKAIEWLIENNHLYSNVQINLNRIREEINRGGIQMITSQQVIENEPPHSGQNNGSLQEHQQFFKNLDTERSILRGTFNQANDRFDEESRGVQCTANAATAIAYASFKPLSSWSPADLDRVLLAGNSYYLDCVSRLDPKPVMLNTEELVSSVTISNINFNLEIYADVIVGVIKPSFPSEVPDGYYSHLESGVEFFFRAYERGIVTCETKIAVAIMRFDSNYYLFDSHSRGPKGFVARNNGTSMLMKFSRLELLCRHLLIVLQVKNERDLQFSITAITASVVDMSHSRVEIQSHLNVKSIERPLNDNNESVSLSGVSKTHDRSVFETVLDGSFLQANESPPVADIRRKDGSHLFENVRDGEIITTGLMLIDTSIPNLNDVVDNNNIDNESIPIYQLKRKTAPPVSIFTEKRAEELAWVKLFPNGKNGLQEDRLVPITPLDYYQARVMSNEKRFQNNEYLFYALSTVELFKAKQNVSVCARLRQDGAEVRDIAQNVHLVMRNIRGTQSYWHKAYTDLLAMVKNLGPPHWYLTLSCNDLNWPDILRALLAADDRAGFPPENLTFQEKLRLVELYPVTLSRQFMFRLNAFFTHLKQGHDPILTRQVIDFWWRIEFQLRGSPHVHMVIWCENFPPFDTDEGIQILDQVVTCKIPDRNDDPELYELVTRLQMHKHTHTCFKNSSNHCRFSFPRPITDTTQILDDDQTVRQGGRFYLLKRNDSERMINNYNPRMLRIWKANLDIQPCCSAMGIAYYISKYISKSEPTEVSQAIREAIRRVQEKGGNFGKQIFAMQAAILTHRQVSACECAYRLCHLKLRDSSRKCVFVNTCTPELRYRILRFDPTENSELFKNIFDRYVSRPRNLEHLSLGEFAVWFEPTKHREWNEEDQDLDAYDEHEQESSRQQQYISLLDNMGQMKKRKRPAILRTRYFTPSSDPESYYYSLLVAHVPFRDETELLQGYDTAKDAFFNKRHIVRPLQEGYDAETMSRWENEIQQAISRLVAENLATNIDNRPDGNENYNNVELILAEEAQVVIDEVIEDYSDMQTEFTDQQYESAVASLNLKQRQLFKKVSDKLLLDTPESEPLRVFVTGGAGTGKTFTLKVIVEQIRRLIGHQQNRAVAVTAPTGVAAKLIGGSTLHSTFALPIEKGKPEPLRPLTGERLQRERQKWNHIKWLIIDEISMVPYLTLRNIHLRLQQLKNNQCSFGNVNIILFGDLMQLPPVSKTSGGAYCFRQPQSLSAEIDLWQLFSFCELPQNMRQAGDSSFINILNSLRVGELTMEQLEVLDRRRVPLVGQFGDGESIRIFPTTKQVDSYNILMTSQLEKTTTIYKVDAIDVSVEAKTYGQKPKQVFIPDDPNKTGGILVSVNIGIGSRVMLRRNLNVNYGLINGAMGVIRKIEWPALRREQLEPGELPSAVFVEFDDASIRDNLPGIGVKIEPSSVEFDALRGQGKIERRMLPLILCWAVTIHKLQGTTLDRAVVDLGPHLFAKGQAYVALSRVKALDGLAISSFEPKRLLNKPHDENALKELLRLRSLPSFDVVAT